MFVTDIRKEVNYRNKGLKLFGATPNTSLNWANEQILLVKEAGQEVK